MTSLQGCVKSVDRKRIWDCLKKGQISAQRGASKSLQMTDCANSLNDGFIRFDGNASEGLSIDSIITPLIPLIVLLLHLTRFSPFLVKCALGNHLALMGYMLLRTHSCLMSYLPEVTWHKSISILIPKVPCQSANKEHGPIAFTCGIM